PAHGGSLHFGGKYSTQRDTSATARSRLGRLAGQVRHSGNRLLPSANFRRAPHPNPNEVVEHFVIAGPLSPTAAIPAARSLSKRGCPLRLRAAEPGSAPSAAHRVAFPGHDRT